jgi:hypothetical protein
MKFILRTLVAVSVLIVAGNTFAQSLILSNTASVKVTVNIAYVKDVPNSFGKTVGEVKKGITFKIVEIKDPWVKVSYNNSFGWINKTAFADRKSFVSYKGEVKSEITTTTAAARSITSAMITGLNLNVFIGYKEVNGELNFSALEAIETDQSNVDPLVKYTDFRKTGKLGEYK